MGIQTSAGTPRYPLSDRYLTVAGHKIYCVEIGAGDPVLFLHGNPTSSYVWRDVMPAVAEATGRRCVAIDLLGLGRSDKPDDVTHTRGLGGMAKERGGGRTGRRLVANAEGA